MEAVRAYKVETEDDVEGKLPYRVLGHATGKQKDIKAFYDNQKCWKIHLERITIRHITPAAQQELEALLNEQKQLKGRMRELGDIIGDNEGGYVHDED